MPAEINDREERRVLLYKSKEGKEARRTTEAYFEQNGDLILYTQDIGEIFRRVWGDSDYEYWVTVKAEHKDEVLLALLSVLVGGEENAADDFKNFLESKGIPCEFSSWT